MKTILLALATLLIIPGTVIPVSDEVRRDIQRQEQKRENLQRDIERQELQRQIRLDDYARQDQQSQQQAASSNAVDATDVVAGRTIVDADDSVTVYVREYALNAP